MEIFKLENGEFIELHDLLKVMGFCSTGGEAKIAIVEGLVSVDGKVEQKKRCKIRKDQVVEYSGKKLTVK